MKGYKETRDQLLVEEVYNASYLRNIREGIMDCFFDLYQNDEILKTRFFNWFMTLTTDSIAMAEELDPTELDLKSLSLEDKGRFIANMNKGFVDYLSSEDKSCSRVEECIDKILGGAFPYLVKNDDCRELGEKLISYVHAVMFAVVLKSQNRDVEEIEEHEIFGNIKLDGDNLISSIDQRDELYTVLTSEQMHIAFGYFLGNYFVDDDDLEESEFELLLPVDLFNTLISLFRETIHVAEAIPMKDMRDADEVTFMLTYSTGFYDVDEIMGKRDIAIKIADLHEIMMQYLGEEYSFQTLNTHVKHLIDAIMNVVACVRNFQNPDVLKPSYAEYAQMERSIYLAEKKHELDKEVVADLDPLQRILFSSTSILRDYLEGDVVN